jgi:hypothetical protein
MPDGSPVLSRTQLLQDTVSRHAGDAVIRPDYMNPFGFVPYTDDSVDPGKRPVDHVDRTIAHAFYGTAVRVTVYRRKLAEITPGDDKYANLLVADLDLLKSVRRGWIAAVLNALGHDDADTSKLCIDAGDVCFQWSVFLTPADKHVKLTLTEYDNKGTAPAVNTYWVHGGLDGFSKGDLNARSITVTRLGGHVILTPGAPMLYRCCIPWERFLEEAIRGVGIPFTFFHNIDKPAAERKDG